MKICGLLGSNHDGERAAAAHAATELLKAHRLTWAELLAALRPAAVPEARAEPPRDWRAVAARCARRPDALTAWEARFVDNLLGRRRISAKQHRVLGGIAAKVMGGEPRG